MRIGLGQIVLTAVIAVQFTGDLAVEARPQNAQPRAANRPAAREARVNRPDPIRVNRPERPRVNRPDPIHVNRPERPRANRPDPIHVNRPDQPRVNRPVPVSRPDHPRVNRPGNIRDRREDVRDRREDVRDRREDRADRREDVRDRREDRRDRLEDIRDRREDIRDARHDGGAADRREDRRDRLEDIRDRREDRADRREDIRDRREDVRDRREDRRDHREDINERVRERREQLRRDRAGRIHDFNHHRAYIRDYRNSWRFKFRFAFQRDIVRIRNHQMWANRYGIWYSDCVRPAWISYTLPIQWYRPMPDYGTWNYSHVETVADNMEFLTRNLYETVAQYGSSADYVLPALEQLADAAENFDDAVNDNDDWTDSLNDLFYLEQMLDQAENNFGGQEAQFGVDSEMRSLRYYVNELLWTYRQNH